MPRTPEETRSHYEYHGAGHVLAFAERLRLASLMHHFPPLAVWAVYVLINCFIAIALLSFLAVVTGNPFVFPSLGPTAYLFFFTPLVRSANPRHAILGHGIGLICGYGALLAAGALAFHPGLPHGINGPTAIAAALSLSTTGALMVLFRVSHPPAGATTLIVSLGLISKPVHLLIIEAAVFLLVAHALLINRLAGLPYPMWEEKPLESRAS